MMTVLGDALTDEWCNVADQLYDQMVDEMVELYNSPEWRVHPWVEFCQQHFHGALTSVENDVPEYFWQGIIDRLHKGGLPHEDAATCINVMLLRGLR